MTGACPAPALIRRKGTAWPGIEIRPGRHPPPSYHWCHVAPELAGVPIDTRGLLAGADAGEKTPDVGRDRAGQPEGPRDLGHVDEEGELSGSGVDRGRITKTAKAVPRR
jgi:hypothetical protein